jgi:hypothetical protein
MISDMTIIGGADGPTSIFLAKKTGAGWLNVLGILEHETCGNGNACRLHYLRACVAFCL